MTVETGSLTAFCAVLELIFYLKWKENNVHMIPALVLSKLYSNTLVATLNSRNPQYRSSQRSELETNGLHYRGQTTMGTSSKMVNMSGQVHFDDVCSRLGTYLEPNNMKLMTFLPQDRSQPTKVQITTHQETHHEDGIPMSDMDKHSDGFDDSASELKINNDALTSRNIEPLDANARRYYQRKNTDDVEAARNPHPYAA